MDLQIHCTQDGIVSYPIHKHNNYEIMIYLEGTGALRTTQGDYPFVPGTIIIIPPGTEHGSSSEKGFRNISICGKFENLLHFENIITLSDNAQSEGKTLATIIYNNRHKNNDYLAELCSAYIHFILQYISATSGIETAVNEIMRKIANNFYDSNINLCRLLQESCYAEDYIRMHFKKTSGKTPNAFLTDIRIKHAVFLIDIYADTLSLQQIAERCGYTDYVYFSKKFKKITGMSPLEYKNSKSR